MDVLVGVSNAAQRVLQSQSIGENIRQNIPAGVQPLTHGTGEDQLRNTGGERIDRDDAAGEFPASGGLHHGICHLAAKEIAFCRTVENVGFALVKIVFQPRLIEKGDVQRAGFIHRAEFHQIQTSANVGQSGRRCHHGFHTGGLTRLKVGDASCFPTVVILSREPCQEIPQGMNIQLCQRFGALFADAFDIAHIAGKIAHGFASLQDGYLFHYNPRDKI